MRQAGYSLGELAVVLAITGILASLAIPLFMTYNQAARLGVAAEEVTAFLNQGRQLAIRENSSACVHIAPTAVQYRLGDCTAAAWTGSITDATGNIQVPAGVTLTTTADPIFSYLGAANPGATITVTNSQDGQTLPVCVALSGRVKIGPCA